MKRLSAILATLFFLGVMSHAQSVVGGTASFDKLVHDFGCIGVKSGPQSCEFTVTNVGTEDLCILSVTNTCSCTKVQWTRETIPAGGQGTISVVYANDEGVTTFDKVLWVYLSNMKKPTSLHVRGNVRKN